MRKFLLSAVALTGIAVAIPLAAPAQAQPLPGYAAGPGLVQPVQYYGGWRDRERQRHEYWRWRRHEEWRARHFGYRHGY